MSKTDKKVISIFLLLIMFISQFSMILATEGIEKPTKTLTQYLIENGVDENGDGELSDAEWAKVKKLNLENIDLAGIEKAINLQYLYVNTCNLENIDFSKLDKLETVDIYNCYGIKSIEKAAPNLKSLDFYKINSGDSILEIDFSNFEKLEDLSMNLWNSNFSMKKTIDLSKLENLKSIYIDGFNVNIKFPIFKSLSYINLKDVNIEGNLDFEACENVFGEISDYNFENIKVNSNTMVYAKNDYCRLLNLENEINIVKGGKEYVGGFEVKSNEDDNIATIGEENLWGYKEINAKNIGTTNIIFKDALGKEKTMKINVIEKPNFDKQLENTGITAKILSDRYNDVILKSNGELWQVTSETTAEKIDTNVKKYVADDVYVTGLDIYINVVINTLKNDNSLTINYEETTKKISNVQQVESNVYLTTDGKLYELGLNYITEEIKPKLIKENVKKLLGECIVLNDGTTWYQDCDRYHTTSNVKFKKLADFEIKDMGYVDGKQTVVDNQNNLWCCKNGEYYFNDSGLEIMQENFEGYKLFTHDVLDGIKLLDNGDAALTYYSEEENKTLVGETILTNVTQIIYNGLGDGYVLIRTDGTIWTYSDRTGLTKITKSTPSDTDNNKNEEFLKPTAQINSKELGNSTAISGISNNTDVKSFIEQNNFSSEYIAKVYDKNNREITGEQLLGTGSTVKLYNNGKVVKEYVVVIYGDTTGDGKITAVDALAIIKHINKKITFTNAAYVEAGRVRQTSGTTLTAVDALAIIKGVNGKYTINQKK